MTQLQTLLNAHLPGGSAVGVDGAFGRQTETAVRAFQRSHALSVDGEVGPNTWRALEANRDVETLYRYAPGPQEPLADIAVPYIGATEARGNRMGDDPRMREIFEADRYAPNGATDGYAWCCAFVCLCVQKLVDQSDAYCHITKPTTPSVTGFRTRWAPNQRCVVFNVRDKTYKPHKGDIVVYTFSHIGIVESVDDSGTLTTIEGNTSVEGSREGTTVRRQLRVPGVVRCLIRLPVPQNYGAEVDAGEDSWWGGVQLWSSAFFSDLLTRPFSPSQWTSFRARKRHVDDSGLVGNACGRRPGPTGH